MATHTCIFYSHLSVTLYRVYIFLFFFYTHTVHSYKATEKGTHCNESFVMLAQIYRQYLLMFWRQFPSLRHVYPIVKMILSIVSYMQFLFYATLVHTVLNSC